MTSYCSKTNKPEISTTLEESSDSSATVTSLAKLGNLALDLSQKNSCASLGDGYGYKYDHKDDGDDDDNVSFCSTTNPATTSKTESSEEEERLDVAKKENQAILKLRLLVFDFLLVATIAFGLGAYLWMSGLDRTAYNEKYQVVAQTVIDAFLGIATQNLPALAGLALALEIQGDQQWPFVTLDRFHELSVTYRDQAQALYVQVNPIVSIDEREEWESYVTGENFIWVEEGLEYQDNMGMFDFTNGTIYQHHEQTNMAEQWPIWFLNSNGMAVADRGEGPFLPTWQTSPILYNGQLINENILKNKYAFDSARESIANHSIIVDKFVNAPKGDLSSENKDTSFFSLLLSIQQGQQVDYQGDALSQVFVPLFDSKQKPAGVMVAWIHWMTYFQYVLPSDMMGVTIVLNDSCGGNFTYVLDGPDVHFVDQGDHHSPSYDDTMREATLQFVDIIPDGTQQGLPLQQGRCDISIQVYSSNSFHSIFRTNTPEFLTAVVVVIFVSTALLFIAYDRLVERRQKLVVASAERSNAIVSSLFPKNVRDRLMQTAEEEIAQGSKDKFVAPNRRLKGFLSGNEEDDIDMEPIADLFPNCTVLFADIAGFTAWSSTRDPAQVFILLQTVYQAFDAIAKRRRVFKVETIGDSYVAATGLPEPQETHAAIMARFAMDCRARVNQLFHHLETRLGPDTAELSMRFGIHSGPVTAGVLRGDRARFQLFGDTVNTAARMEHTGVPDMIQISSSTYALLVEAGKESWTKPRNGVTIAKGKGCLQTYWLQTNKQRRRTSGTGSVASMPSEDYSEAGLDTSSAHLIDDIGDTGGLNRMSPEEKAAAKEAARRQDRLVNWMVELFTDHIRKIIAMRKPTKNKGPTPRYRRQEGKTSLDEVAEVIVLPRFDEECHTGRKDAKEIEIGSVVTRQLHHYISIIASQYRDNHFHNFEHACHVTMCTSKFLKRIVSPDISDDGDVASKLHDYTHGINSDPLSLLAICFSALIHDVDHRGVGNAQLMKEDPNMGERYRGKSVAEQNSLDLSWDLLCQDQFEQLRGCLFSTQEEMNRFRQVLVNVVLATDIFDPELNGLRKKRWEKAFSPEHQISTEENKQLRATIVIEHIIQASDVSHTMQHWHIYRKWNRRLFMELYQAYKQGRMAKDPSEFWYAGEIGFFDNYIIPLAKKLKDCQVFGVSSDECLNYAMMNRDEWKVKGQEIVAEMMEEVSSMGF